MINSLKAGAGKAKIMYTMEMLPTYGENYNDIHDLPFIQVLYLESKLQIAIISIDVVMLEIKDKLCHIASGILEIPEENILLHCTHVLATPHFKEWESVEAWQNDFMHSKNPVDVEVAQKYMEKEQLMVNAHVEALKTACTHAKKNIQPAKIGFGKANANINVNRVVETANGWWQGVNQDGITDHNISILRVDDLKGEPLAILYNCNVAPGCMEFSEVNGGRKISGDLAAASEQFVDNVYGNHIVSIYTTGATGDQWQALRARVDYIDQFGNQQIMDLGEEGFTLVKILATRLGEQVIKSVNKINSQELFTDLSLDSYEYIYDGQKVSVPDMAGPTRECQYITSGKVKCEIKILHWDDIAIIACGVELGVESLHRIQNKSPFKNTFIMEFTTNGGGYMPEKIFYDQMNFQSRKSRYARGSAEQFELDVADGLQNSYQNQLGN